MTFTPTDKLALEIIRDHPRIASQALAYLLKLKRACGIELTAQGAGRLGALRGSRLVKMNYATKCLVHDGYCQGYNITKKGLAILRERIQP